MARRTLRLLASLLATALASAASATDAVISDKDLNDTLDLGEEIEARVDGDLDADGDIDTVYLARGDQRILTVLLRQDGPGRQRYVPAGALRLDSDALAPARLSIARGVLVVRDKVGKTATLASTYRYRIAAKQRMRLIGLDSTLETGSAERDGFEISWNLLDGAIVTRVLRTQDPAPPLTYARLFEQRFTRPSPPVLMEDTPEPEMVMVDIRKR